jgi:hypothetical protein
MPTFGMASASDMLVMSIRESDSYAIFRPGLIVISKFLWYTGANHMVACCNGGRAFLCAVTGGARRPSKVQ